MIYIFTKNENVCFSSRIKCFFFFCLVLRKQIKFWLIVAIIIISKEKKIHASVIFNGPYLEIQWHFLDLFHLFCILNKMFLLKIAVIIIVSIFYFLIKPIIANRRLLWYTNLQSHNLLNFLTITSFLCD